MSSFRLKLILFYLFSTTTIFIAFGLFYYNEIENDIRKNIDSNLEVIGRDLMFDLSQKKYDIDVWKKIIDEETIETGKNLLTLIQVSILDQNKSYKISSDTKGNIVFPENHQVEKNGKFETISSPQGNNLRLYTIYMKRKGEPGSKIQIATPMKHYELSLNKHTITLLFTGPVLILFFTILGYIFIDKNLKIVWEITENVKNITASDLSKRLIIPYRSIEFTNLITVLNDMIGRLEVSFEQYQRFSGDASHELKTPLTAMRGDIEIALRASRTTEEYETTLIKLSALVKQMESIINSLFFLSSIDSGNIPYIFTNRSLDEILLEECENAISNLPKKIKFQFCEIENVSLQCVPLLMQRLFSNLIENAVKYTPENGSIEIFMYTEEESGVFKISDTGIGIDPSEHIKIFERFYRTDRSRSRTSGGVGLGLAIVDWIIKIHKGRIVIKSDIGKGTTFTCFFPLIQPEVI